MPTTKPNDEYKALARELLAASAHGERTPAVLAKGVQRALGLLRQKLGAVIGEVGFNTLLQLAIRDTGMRHPFIAGLSVYDDELEAGELLATMADTDYDSLREGFEELIAGLIRTLAQFVGKDLALLLAREASPRGEDHAR